MQRLRNNCATGLRSGLTLIEVVAGLALMGTLLVTVILGASSHLRQLRVTQRKQAAITVLDKLLTSWSRRGFSHHSLPECAKEAGVHLTDARLPETSAVESNAISVRVQTRPAALSSGLNLEVVRLEALPNQDQPSASPLTWLEVVRTPTPDAIRAP